MYDGDGVNGAVIDPMEQQTTPGGDGVSGTAVMSPPDIIDPM